MNLRSVFLCLALLLPAFASAQGTTAFTYQGRLYNNGTLVNGSGYVLRVTPYAQESGGNALVPAVVTPPLNVVDGVFSTTLDFGAVGVFFGQAVWLAIEVQAPASSFVPLLPRQPVSPTPYAINADTVDGFSASELQGQQGQQGVQGPPGPPGSTGIVAAVSLNGVVTSPLPQTNTIWTFVGPTATITTSSTSQRLLGGTSIAVGTSTGTAIMDFGLCYRLGAAGTVSNFAGSGYLAIQLTSTRSTVSTSASVVPGAVGTYTVGPCVRAVSSATVSNTDFANGWVILTN